MQKIKKQLITELDNLLKFWLDSLFDKPSGKFITEYSNEGIANSSVMRGSMFYSRIIYGASAACKLLKTDKYKILADSAFKILTDEFKNPGGGYYWAKEVTGEMVHDSENVNLAQAFILFGLVEYASLTQSPDILETAHEQFSFIQTTLHDPRHGGYLDDFDINWNPLKVQTKALGTHLHLLEAFVKLYLLTNDNSLVPEIEKLITLILDKFITKDKYECLHRLTPDWQPLPNFVWAGHEAECSWILCHSAKAIKNNALEQRCNEMAKKIMDKVIRLASDARNGGLFNDLKNDKPTEEGKIWWPQAEFVLGLLNFYIITGDYGYRELALKQINYISNNFIAPNGGWYTEISGPNQPNQAIPQVHFWKSLYHNVRYYMELDNYLS